MSSLKEYSSADDVAKRLIEAKVSQRQIVPVVGAGISADSGFPILTSIVRYFGKLHQYIHRNAYLLPEKDISGQRIVKAFTKEPEINQLACQANDLLAAIDRDYKKAPWTYIQDFGWPDRFQLNQELFAKLELLEAEYYPTAKASREKIESRELVAFAVRAGLDEMLWSFNETGHRNYWKVHEDIYKELTKVLDKSHPDSEKILEEIEKRFAEKSENKNAAFEVVGNWQRLIQYFTNFQSDYSDALFARFGAGRNPNRGHRFLAFLARALHVRAIFTFNFDSLIEEALTAERMDPLIFSMEHGDNLPHSSLLRNRLSVVKMHGSTHALLLDEQLDHPLSEDYLERFDKITGQAPLLLVIGCSAGDYRLRHLVRHSVEQSDGEVLWMHYEDRPPEFLAELAKPRADKRLTTKRINSVGMALMHIHGRVTDAHPSSHVRYLAHIDQPICQGDVEADAKAIAKETGVDAPDERQFVVFSSLGKLEKISITPDQKLSDAIGQNKSWDRLKAKGAATDLPQYSASEQLLAQANKWARWGYQMIWIDLENCYQFAGVIESIIDQCRRYDVELPSSVLSVEEERATPAEKSDKIAQTRAHAVEKIARALRRTRYFLALDGLEAYVWPVSAHHGSTCRGTQTPSDLLSELVQFLADLTDDNNPAGLGESRVAVSVDAPKFRFQQTTPQAEDDCLEIHVKWLQTKTAQPEAAVGKDVPLTDIFDKQPIPDLDNPQPNAAARLVSLTSARIGSDFADDKSRRRLEQTMFLLSCWRRIRPLALLRRTLRPLWEDTTEIDKALAKLSEPSLKPILLLQLEDGGYWFSRSARDYVYEQCTWFTGRQSLNKCLKTALSDRAWWDATAFQLLFASLTHQQIAQAWYSEAFVQSQDTYAFLEFTYHRVSSIRSITKLLALTRVAQQRLDQGDEDPAQGLWQAISACREYIANVAHPEQQRTEFELDNLKEDGLADLLQDTPPAGLADNLRGTLGSLKTSLEERHFQELQRLCNSWTRSEMVLRAQVPAQQLLLWCKQLIKDDLPFRCNRVVVGYSSPSGSVSGREPQFYQFDDRSETVNSHKGIDDVIVRFIECLEELQTKLWIDRSAYEAVVNKWEDDQKKLAARDDNTAASGEAADPLKKAHQLALACNRQLDVANSYLKAAQERKSTSQDLSAALKDVEARLDTCRQQIDNTQDGLDERARGVVAGDMHEALLRWCHIQIQCKFAQVSIFSHDGFLGKQTDIITWKARADAASEYIRQAIGQIRSQDPRTIQSPHGSVADPTVDGTFYLQYRALFYLLRGREKWMLSEAEEPDARAAGYRDAMRDFEIAPGGLVDHNLLIAAQVDMYAAEACLGRARVLLYRDGASLSMDDNKVTDVLNQAAAQHEAARTFLQHARRLLLAGRRSAIWWKLFFRLITQYHADRLLLKYTDAMAHKERVTRENAIAFLIRLRKAYQSLRTACDHYPPRTVTVPLRWLRRLWLEISLCSYCAGQYLLKLEDSSGKPSRIPSPDERLNYVVKQLRWLNKGAALDPLPAGFLDPYNVKDCVEQLPKLLAKIAADTGMNPEEFFEPCQEGQWSDALDRRRTLLEAVDQRVKGDLVLDP